MRESFNLPCDDGKPDFVQVEEYKLSLESDGVPMRTFSPMLGEDPRFTLAGVEPEDALKMVLAPASREHVQFGITPTSASVREVYRFIGKISQDDLRSLMACLDGVNRKMQKLENSLQTGDHENAMH